MSVENPSDKTENVAERKNPLLEGPRILSPEDKENLQKELLNHVSSFDKDFGENKKLVYRLGNNNGRPFFVIECKEEYFETLDESLREKFTKDGNIYIFKCGDAPALEKAQSEDSDEKYLIASRRDLSEQKNKPEPRIIEEGDISGLIDPDVLCDGKIMPLSVLDGKYKEALDKEKLTAIAGVEI